MLIVFNPAAGRRRAQRLWRVLDLLVQNGIRLELAETGHRGHATELAREGAARGAGLIVAAGGDGTIAEVANGLCGAAVSLGVIPLGTANVLAHELGLPFAPRAVAAALAFGRTRLLWPGIARGPSGERLFVQMLGAGFDAAVVHHLSDALKRLCGRGAYVAQSLCEIACYNFPKLHLRLDGKELDAASVIVSKGRFYAGRHLLAPGASPMERGFTVAVFRRRGRLPALVSGALLPFDLLPRAPGMCLVRAAAVDIEGSAPAQADGDPAGTATLRITDAPAPIAIVAG
ncbi:MAG TPA: diacylglycerol kinase family protein [Acetobacteraceae bacterium]|nr:diacylglycerol kinase family protein [Acetobacteraceae bacterium]